MSSSSQGATRRTLLRASSVPAVFAMLPGSPASAATVPAAGSTSPAVPRDVARLFGELDEKIQTGMKQYVVPGAAVGVLYRGFEYVKGYGVTNVDYPTPVDGDTVFGIGSTTKTFTGTAVMRLVEAGTLDLDTPVQQYLPDFRTADAAVAGLVTIRQLLNHSAGWLGDFLVDTGPGDDAAARFAQALAKDPQLTAPGTVFGYNNAAVALAGRVIEVVTGTTYERAVRDLVIDPLGLAHTRFFADEIIGLNIAASHSVVEGTVAVAPGVFGLPRALNPAGGIVSSVRDQLRYARFHLGDGTVPPTGATTPGGTTTTGGDGSTSEGSGRLLRRQSLAAMRSHPGPGGTLFVELDGVGVSWTLRPSAEGVRIVQHGGDIPHQHSGFLMVPDRHFAITLLTNSDSGPQLVSELFVDDWALRRFAGLHNLPAEVRTLSADELAPYEGTYIEQEILPTGELISASVQLTATDGHLAAYVSSTVVAAQLLFYRPDFVLVAGPDGTPTPSRADFVRDSSGRVAWLRVGGRLLRHESESAASAQAVPGGAARSSINPFRRALPVSSWR